MTPKRIQRKRTKGWRMPHGAVYVGRPTFWGNPCRFPDRAEAVKAFRSYLDSPAGLEVRVRADVLRGLDLACWCPLDEPCHADVLLEIANGGDS